MKTFAEGPRYTLEGYMKKILFHAQSPIDESELVEEVTASLGASEHEYEEIAARVHKALNRNNSPFLQETKGWRMKPAFEASSLNSRAVEALVLASAPQSYGRILEYIGLTTKRSRGDLMSHIDLDGDPRFCRLEDGQWVLTEWALDSKGFPESVNELPYDPVLAKKREEQQMETIEKQPNKNAESTDFALNSNSFIQQMLSDLESYVVRMEHRQSEIPALVVKLFEEENLAGIETLMLERKELSKIQEDLKMLVSKYSQNPNLLRA